MACSCLFSLADWQSTCFDRFLMLFIFDSSAWPIFPILLAFLIVENSCLSFWSRFSHPAFSEDPRFIVTSIHKSIGLQEHGSPVWGCFLSIDDRRRFLGGGLSCDLLEHSPSEKNYICSCKYVANKINHIVQCTYAMTKLFYFNWNQTSFIWDIIIMNYGII